MTNSKLTDFGLHRLGFLSIKRPIASTIIILGIILISLVGLSRLSIDTSLTKLFHGGSKEYSEFARLLNKFPAAEHDAYIVVKGRALFQPESLEALREMHLAVRLTPGVRQVMSILSAREKISDEEEPPLIMPDPLPGNEELRQIEDRLLAHPIVAGRLLSPKSGDHQITVLLVALKPSAGETQDTDQPLAEIRQLAKDILEPANLKWKIGGVPVARSEMIEAIDRDFVYLNSIGFVIGLVVCAFFLRRFSFVLLSGLGPFLAALLSGGLIGLAGAKINPLMTAIPLLIMAITFTDSVHLIYSIRSYLDRGESLRTAIECSIRDVGPACILASVTTAVALFTLMLTDSPLVKSFGFWAGLSSLVSVFLLVFALPFFAIILLSDKTGKTRKRQSNPLSTMISQVVANFVNWQPRLIAILAIIATVLLGVLYSQLGATYRLSGQVPFNSDFRAVNEDFDKQLGGASQIAILLEPRHKESSSEKTIAALRTLHIRLLNDRKSSSVLSVMSLFGEPDNWKQFSDSKIDKYLVKLPKNTVGRLIDSDTATAVLWIQVPDYDAAEMSRVADTVAAIAKKANAHHPEIKMTVTGLPVLLARGAPSTVSKINHALVAAFGIVFLMIAIAFRSVRVALLAMVPNFLPVFAAGGVIYLVAGGLDYASVIGLTVAFGLAVDDSTHFLNRLFLENGTSENETGAVRSAILSIGPVLIMTTVVLLFAMATSGFSEMPATRIFGQACVATLLAALIADLLVLPSIVLSFGRSVLANKS